MYQSLFNDLYIYAQAAKLSLAHYSTFDGQSTNEVSKACFDDYFIAFPLLCDEDEYLNGQIGVDHYPIGSQFFFSLSC
jgi:hypothetical protein